MIVGMTIKKQDWYWFNSQQLALLDGLIRCSKLKRHFNLTVLNHTVSAW